MAEKEKIEKSKSGMGFLWFLILIIVFGNSFLIWRMQDTVLKVDKYNQGVVDEIGGFRGDIKNFADDLNEIRSFLLLPEKEYSFDDQQKSKQEDQEENDKTTQGLYAMLNQLKLENQKEENRVLAEANFDKILTEDDFLKELEIVNLVFGERSDLNVKLNDNLSNIDSEHNPFYGQALFAIVYDDSINKFRVQSVLGEETFANDSDLKVEIEKYIHKATAEARQKKIDDQNKEADLVKEAEENALKDIEKKKDDLLILVNENAFKSELADLGLTVSDKTREENNKFIVDIVDSKGGIKFSISLDISSNMVKVIKDGQEIDVKNFLDNNGSKKKP